MNILTRILSGNWKKSAQNVFESVKAKKTREEKISLLSGKVIIVLPRAGTLQVKLKSGLDIVDDGAQCVKTWNGRQETLDARASIRRGLFGGKRLEIKGDKQKETIYSDGRMKINTKRARFVVYPDGNVRGQNLAPSELHGPDCWAKMDDERMLEDGTLTGTGLATCVQEGIENPRTYNAVEVYRIKPYVTHKEIVGQ